MTIHEVPEVRMNLIRTIRSEVDSDLPYAMYFTTNATSMMAGTVAGPGCEAAHPSKAATGISREMRSSRLFASYNDQ